jgi:hypothetical protein
MSATEINAIIALLQRIDAAKPARFSFTQAAYDNNLIEGVDDFNIANDQNIPNASKTDYDPVILDRGARSQAASIPRMAWDHFLGRFSYNVAKLAQQFLAYAQAEKIAAAHNAFEYDAAQAYKQFDVCFVISTVSTVSVFEFYRRTSASPLDLVGVSPKTPGQTDWTMVPSNAGLLNGLGSTAAATANTVAARGADGTLKAATPAATDDLTTKAYTDALVTAAALLAKILTVDGAGSGLDADLLDGQHGAYYLNAGNLNAGTVPLAQIPATLTGKSADQLDGYDAGNGAGQIPISNGAMNASLQAGYATSAGSATNATNATNAANADTLDGRHRLQIYDGESVLGGVDVDGNNALAVLMNSGASGAAYFATGTLYTPEGAARSTRLWHIAFFRMGGNTSSGTGICFCTDLPGSDTNLYFRSYINGVLGSWQRIMTNNLAYNIATLSSPGLYGSGTTVTLADIYLNVTAVQVCQATMYINLPAGGAFAVTVLALNGVPYCSVYAGGGTQINLSGTTTAIVIYKRVA